MFSNILTYLGNKYNGFFELCQEYCRRSSHKPWVMFPGTYKKPSIMVLIMPHEKEMLQ